MTPLIDDLREHGSISFALPSPPALQEPSGCFVLMTAFLVGDAPDHATALILFSCRGRTAQNEVPYAHLESPLLLGAAGVATLYGCTQ